MDPTPTPIAVPSESTKQIADEQPTPSSPQPRPSAVDSPPPDTNTNDPPTTSPLTLNDIQIEPKEMDAEEPPTTTSPTNKASEQPPISNGTTTPPPSTDSNGDAVINTTNETSNTTLPVDDDILKNAVIRNADSDDSDVESIDDTSPVTQMNSLYQHMLIARDPTTYLSQFSPFFSLVFALRLDAPEVSREIYSKDENLQYFMKNIVPNLVRFLLTMDPPAHNRLQAPIVNQFLQACILTCIHSINMDIPELMLTLALLFGAPVIEKQNGQVVQSIRSFYHSCGMPRTRQGDIVWDEDILEAHPEKMPAEVLTRVSNVVPPFPTTPTIGASSSTSVSLPVTSKSGETSTFVSSTGKRVFGSSWYMLRNIRFFGEQGGFYMILDRINRALETQKAIGLKARSGAATAAASSSPSPSTRPASPAIDASATTSATATTSTTPPLPSVASSSVSEKDYPRSLTIVQLIHLLTPLCEMRTLLSNTSPSDFLPLYALEVKDAVLTYLHSIEEEEFLKSINRKVISRPLLQVELLLQAASPHITDTDIKRIMELNELEFSWMYVRNKNLPLDRRINAINDIKDAIEYVEKKEDYFRKRITGGGLASAGTAVLGYVNHAVASSLNMVEPPPGYTKQWMTNEALCKWLIQNKVLEELLDPATTHIELIRRSFSIMKALSSPTANPSTSKGVVNPTLLTTDHLDLLWQLSCMGKHESIEHLIYDIVAKLSFTLPVSLMNHIYKRMCEKSFADYDVIFLTLVYNFTLNTLRPDSAVAQAAASSPSTAKLDQTYGIDLFWSLLQSTHTHAWKPGTQSPTPGQSSTFAVSSPISSSSPSTEVFTKARNFFLTLLEIEGALPLRTKYMDRCVSNVKAGILVSQSLHILLKLIQMYPIKSSGWFGSGSTPTRGTIIENLEKQYDLLNLILIEMNTFQTKRNKYLEDAQITQSEANPPPAASAATISAASTSHLEQLDMRQEFFVTLLTHSSLTLSKTQIDLIWQSLVQESSNPHSCDTVFAWLTDACDSDGTIMSEEVKAYLFHAKLLTLSPATLSPMAFKLILKYFLRVHSKSGALKLDEPSTNSKSAQTETEFSRILGKHRGLLPKSSPAKGLKSASSSALPFSKPQLQSSPSDLSLLTTDYTTISDEDQLAMSPQFESTVLSSTQQLCSSLTIQQYSEIKGIAFLWAIILRNPRARVARQSIVLLNTIHQNLSGKLKTAGGGPNESPAQIRDAHLKACLTHMSKALQETTAQPPPVATGASRPGSITSLTELAVDLQTKKKVSRCIYLLKTFLNGFNKAAVGNSASDEPAEGTFVVHILPSREYRIPAFDLTMKKNDTIGELRTQVYQYLSVRNPNISLKSMSLLWDNKKLLTNYFVLATVGFKHGDAVIVKRNSDVFGSYQPNSAVYTNQSATIFTSLFFDVLDEPWQELEGREKYASVSLRHRQVVNEDQHRSWARKTTSTDPTLASIASDPVSFDRLFTLLSPNSPISESVFDILMLLPTNQSSIKTFLNVQSISQDKWNLLLDIKSMYRLLYSLQVLEEILTFRSPRHPTLVSLGPEYKNFDLTIWCQQFIQKGGVKYLASLAVNQQVWQQPQQPTNKLGTRRSVGVPKAIYHEVLQSIFSLLLNFFSLDPLFPSGVFTQGTPRGVMLPEGTWTSAKLPNWDAWIKQIVKDGIITAVMNTQIKDVNMNEMDSSNDTHGRDDNSTSMILAGMRLLVSCVHAVPTLLDSIFYQQQAQTIDFLDVLLIKIPSSAGRTQAAQAFLSIFKLSHKTSQPTHQLFWSRVLLQLLCSPSLLLYEKQSAEFFILWTSYLDYLCSDKLRDTYLPQLTSLELFSTSVHLLREHASMEQYELYLEVDEFLCGLLQLIRCIITHGLLSPEAEGSVDEVDGEIQTLLSYVYHECLFHTPANDDAQGCKCKTHTSRIMGFGVLLELSAVYEPCYAQLLRMVSEDPMWTIQRPSTQWGYDPTSLEKSSAQAPLGLKNQGATCYMNSFLQVLFSAKEFRSAIMTMRRNTPPTATAGPISEESKSEDVIQPPGGPATSIVPSSRSPTEPGRMSALHELQLLFGHLAWSQKSFFDTIDFCHTLKDYNGQPLNIAEQKDVNEFASLLFDQLEREFDEIAPIQKDQPQKAPLTIKIDGKPNAAAIAASNASNRAIIDHIFKGSLVHEILSQDQQECPHRTAREEPFYMISLTVVNKTSVEQSLAGFVEGDLLDGDNRYMCGTCQKKVAALKRCCFHDTNLPQYLILHLKRFEFNFDHMRKEKVNDFFSFPYKEGEYLNIEPYTQGGMARAEAAQKGGNEESKQDDPLPEKRPEGFYDYSLVGVLIHGGSAEGGHYITLCKTEAPLEPNSNATTNSDSSATNSTASSSSWFEYNDTVVRPFSAADIPASAFGGIEKIEQFDRTTNKTITRDVSNIKNAYMCIYKRRWKPTDSNDKTIEVTKGLSDESKGSDLIPMRQSTPALSSSSPNSTSGAIWSYDRSRSDLSHFPPDILDRVWNDNISFLHEKYYFEWNMNWFLWNLIHLHLPGSKIGLEAEKVGLAATSSNFVDAQPWSTAHTVPLAQVAVKFVFQLLARSTDNASFPQWIDLLYQIFDWDGSARNWFLSSLIEEGSNGQLQSSPFLTSLLFDCPQQIVREAIGDLIVFVVTATREDKAERALYFTNEQEDSASKSKPNGVKSYPSSPDPTTRSVDPTLTLPPTTTTLASATTLAAPTPDHPSFSLSRSSSPAPTSTSPAVASSILTIHRPRSLVTRLLKWCLDLLPTVRRYHRTYKEFWRMFYHLAKIGSDERKWLIQQGAIRQLVAFYLDPEPLNFFNITAGYGGEPPRRKHVTNSFWMIQLLSLLYRSCETDTLPKSGPSPSQTHRTLVPLMPGDRNLLLIGWCLPIPGTDVGVPPYRPLVPWLLLDRQNSSGVCEMVVHWCYEHANHSCRMIDLLLKSIVSELTTVADLGEYKLIFKTFIAILQIQDSIGAQTARVDYGLSELFVLLRKVVVRNKVGDQKLLFVALQHIIKLSYQSKVVAGWLIKNETKYSNWLQDYRRVHVEITPNSGAAMAHQYSRL